MGLSTTPKPMNWLTGRYTNVLGKRLLYLLSYLLVAAIFAPLIDLWGPVAILNISGVIYTLVGIYAVSRLGILRWEDKSYA